MVILIETSFRERKKKEEKHKQIKGAPKEIYG